MTLLGLKALLPHAFASLFRVRLAPGTNIEAWLRQLERDTHMVAFPPVPPPDVADTGRRRVIPYSIAAIAGVVAVVALAHALLTSVRERRRELAILKTVGFVRSQLVMTVVWQGAAVGVIALLVGLPLGVAAGRWVWTFVTGYLGVLEVTVVPSLQVIAVIPAVLIAVVLVAAWPGRTAAHSTSRSGPLRRVTSRYGSRDRGRAPVVAGGAVEMLLVLGLADRLQRSLVIAGLVAIAVAALASTRSSGGSRAGSTGSTAVRSE